VIDSAARLDFIQNLSGDTVDRLIANDFDVGVLRPWRGADGRTYMTKMVKNNKGVFVPKVVVTNAPATLPQDSWKILDTAVVRAATERLRAFADIRAAGLTFNLPNGMAHTVLQYQTLGDIREATISMDPTRRSEGDRPTMDVANLPLPVIHKDFDFSAREILVGRQGNIPIDTTTAEMAARKVAEGVEKLTVGTAGTFSYGGGTIYGYTNFPYRATVTTMPVPDGTNGPAVVTALLSLRQLLINDRHFGPYRMYVNTQWASVLDNDYSAAKGDQTLRQRILAIEGIRSVDTLDHLPTTNWHVLLVEMSTENVRAVIGMEIQTIQWESLGGMRRHFKVICMLIPQLRPDTGGNSGVAHGTTAAP
jgi:uncharacterized linocin/CFP29 family protein